MKHVLATVLMFSGLAIQPLAAQPPISTAMVGSWRLTFTPKSPVVPAVTPIPGLATFTSDGTVVETDGTEVVPMTDTGGSAAYGTPGHGIWQPGPAITNLYIQIFSLVVNPDSTLRATRVVTINGSLDSTGTHLNATYSSQLLDTAGHVVAAGSGALAGQKIPHPLLP